METMAETQRLEHLEIHFTWLHTAEAAEVGPQIMDVMEIMDRWVQVQRIEQDLAQAEAAVQNGNVHGAAQAEAEVLLREE
jgi:histone acetyltransferase (RNA polymerase elongator complex component)